MQRPPKLPEWMAFLVSTLLPRQPLVQIGRSAPVGQRVWDASWATGVFQPLCGMTHGEYAHWEGKQCYRKPENFQHAEEMCFRRLGLHATEPSI